MKKYEKTTCKSCGRVFEFNDGFFSKKPESAGFLRLGYRCFDCTREKNREKQEELKLQRMEKENFDNDDIEEDADEICSQSNSLPKTGGDFIVELFVNSIIILIVVGIDGYIYIRYVETHSFFMSIIYIFSMFVLTMVGIFSIAVNVIWLCMKFIFSIDDYKKIK